ncbi:MAG TPA: universal stress protein [Chitinophagaceae bacterium]|nr:universal stress protein [Chitinophagaceae bacterium]
MKTILVPTDFSKNANTALRYAIRLAGVTNANIYVLHCFQYSSYKHLVSESEEQRNLIIEQTGKEQLAKLQKHVHKAYKNLGLPVNPATKLQAVFNPFVVEESIHVAKKIKAGLIVMGTHGATGVQKFLFGSNTANMVAKSPLPVLAIPQAYRFKPLKKMLFCSDLAHVKSELQKVVAFAKEWRAVVEILHIDYEGDEQLTKAAQKVIKQNSDINIKLVIEKAQPENSLLGEIRSYVTQNRPHCMAMFTKEHGFWHKLLVGSIVEDITSTLPIPLLSFRRV